MNKIKTVLVTAAVLSSTGGLLVATGTGAQAATDTKDVKSTTGSCSGQADYSYRLADAGSAYGQVRVKFDIDSNKNGRDWTVKVYRNGNLMRTLEDTTGSKGNAYFDTTFVADDDAKIKVYAKAGYGEHCQSTLRLDTTSD